MRKWMQLVVAGGLLMMGLSGCGGSSNQSGGGQQGNAGALAAPIVKQSFDGSATLTIPAGTTMYSDTARTRPVFGAYTTNVLKLRAVAKTITATLPGSPVGFRAYSTLSTQAHSGWVTGSDGIPDVTKELKTADAVVEIKVRRKFTSVYGPAANPINILTSENVETFSQPVNVNLKLPSSYTAGSVVPYYSFDVTKNSWIKEGTATVKADNTIDMSVTYAAQWGVVTFQDYTPPGNPGNGYVPAGTYTTEINIPGLAKFNKVTFLVDKNATALTTVIGPRDAVGTPAVAINGGAITGTIAPTTYGASSYTFTATIAAGTVGTTTVGPITFSGTINPTTGVLTGTYNCVTPAVSNASFSAVNGFMIMKANGQAYAGTDMTANANLRCQLESTGGRGGPLGMGDGDISRGLNAGWDAEWIFDNLAVIGNGWVKCFVLKTSTDLVLIDSLDNPGEANSMIIPGMYKLGVDPTKLTKILITHGHADHWGGASTMKAQAPGSQVFMSAMDDAYMQATHNGGPGAGVPIPTVDVHTTDGQQLVLGDTTVTVVLTPGHTPGCTSYIYPVKDNGVTHMLAQLGGNGVPQVNFDNGATYPGAGLQNAGAYIASIDYFATYTAALGVDATVNQHPFVDNTAGLLKLLRNRKSGDPSPWVIGRTKYKQYEGVTRETAKAYFARFNPL